MKTRLSLVALVALVGMVLLGTGCATSTLESRKQERYGAYTALAPDQKASVDQGTIRVGMPMDAVYIAWGKPSQVLAGESLAGAHVRWLYVGTHLEGFTYWTYYGAWGPYHGYYGPELVHDYAVLNYISAEVVFEGGLVKEWRTLPRPGR